MASLINYNDRWGFIHIPKTGGTSVAEKVKDYNTKYFINHISLKRYPNEDYFYFSIVRNPYTWLLSTYFRNFKYNTNITKTFKDYIKKASNNFSKLPIPSQTYYIKEGETEIRKVSYIGKYETLHDDINVILHKLNKPSVSDVLDYNINSYQKYVELKKKKDYYLSFYEDSELLEFVNKYYRSDFENFNYDMLQ